MSQMHKIIKYVAIGLALSLIVGIFSGIYQVGLLIGGFLSKEEDITTEDVITFNELPSDLSIDVAASTIKIVPGNELKIEHTNKYLKAEIKKDKLVIKETRHNIIGVNNSSHIILYIPENTSFDETKISTGAGTLEIDSLTTSRLDLDVGAGKVTIDKLTVNRKADIESGAGKVTISNSYINDLDLDMGVGEFNLSAILQGKTEIDAGVGALNINLLDSKDNYTINVEKGLGTIKIDNKQVKNDTTYGDGINEIEIDGGVGSINVKFKNN